MKRKFASSNCSIYVEIKDIYKEAGQKIQRKESKERRVMSQKERLI